MNTGVVIALITAASSLFLSLASAGLSYLTKVRSDRLSASLEEAKAERDAQRDYEYEARKRLYTEFQPLMFQLIEASESAYNRVFSLARSTRKGYLDPEYPSWLSKAYYEKDPYYLLTTIHRFLTPLAIIRLMQRRLTIVDCSIDSHVRVQNVMAKRLYAIMSQGFELAETQPTIPYNVLGEGELTRKQHVAYVHLDQAAEALLITEQNGDTRYMSYGEFERAAIDEQSGLRQELDRFVLLFTDFHPHTHPVLWRILITQAHIYRALMSVFEENRIISPAVAISSEEQRKFDWRRRSEATEEDVLDSPFTAARNYLTDRFVGYSLH
jgi:hypothetical protein